MVPGDVKYLKSGSPAMTVNAVNGNDITVQWFAGSDYRSATFPAAALSDSDPVPALEVARRKAAAAEEAKA